MTRKTFRTSGIAALALGAAALLATSAPLSASAHVSLESNTATPGSYDTLTFRVPNEATDGSATNKVTLTLPSDKGLLATVSYIPVPGWTAELVTTRLATPVVNGDQTTTEAVTQVIWTATVGAEYGEGALGVFKLFVGPIPQVGKITIPVEQGYTDGKVVSWGQAPDGDNPAPLLYITDKPVADHDADSAPQTTVSDEHAPAASSDSGTDIVARTLGGVGLVLGAVALVIAIVGRRPVAATKAS
ncbi:hypothetical protein BH10ACT6_BH10ACT6_01680 [soil metagenome]